MSFSRKIYQEIGGDSNTTTQKENVIVHQQPTPRVIPQSIPADLEETIKALKKARPQRSTDSADLQNLSQSVLNICNIPSTGNTGSYVIFCSKSWIYVEHFSSSGRCARRIGEKYPSFA